jgi:hypothetical protein
MTTDDASAMSADAFRQAIAELRAEIVELEQEPLQAPVGNRLDRARSELAIAEAELAALDADEPTVG